MQNPMITIQELTKIIKEELEKRDLTGERSPENKRILKDKCEGTFEAILTGKGNEKCLIPQIGTVQFLYRGQNSEVVPCIPTLYRGNPSEVDIFVERMRLVVFKHLLASSPIIEHFFKRHNFLVDVEGLAQHYGLKTSVLDLTSSLDVALFFATCIYDKDNDSYSFYDDGKEHDAILYVFNPLFDNEPTPYFERYMTHNIKPIGLQAFPRPGVQQGYALNIPRGKSVKCWMYRFSFTCEDSKHYYDMFNKSESLWVKDDIFIKKAADIAKQEEFSYKLFSETFDCYRPKGYSKTKLKKALPDNIKLMTKTSEIVFSDEEKCRL